MLNTDNPVAKNGHWELHLLGYCNETVRKAVLVNYLTNERLNAKVSEKEDKATHKVNYIVTEAVDQKTNKFVEFTKTFTCSVR